MAQPAEDNPPPTGMHAAIFNACESGDLPCLQQFFKDLGIQQGSKTVWIEPDSDQKPPRTHKMLIRAITHNHPHIVAYILSIYSKGDIDHSHVLEALLDRPNVEILRLLHARQPSIINYEWHPMKTFLTQACRGGADAHWEVASPATIPLIYYLLDNGANCSVGWICRAGPIGPAILYRQPVEVLDRILRRRPYISGYFTNAIQQRRVDVIQLFFKKARYWSSYWELLGEAHKTGDQKVIAAVRVGIAKGAWKVWKWW